MEASLFETVGSFILNNGVAVAVVIYFLWKDANLTKENTDILNQVKALLQLLCQKAGVTENNE